jgi:transcriptional regulator
MVQMRGKPHLRDDAAWLRQQVSRMTDHMEHTRAQPWSVQDAPEAFVATQLKAIVGIEIEVTDMQGKWKMSQNRSVQDAQGVVDGLSDPNDPHAHAEVAASVADRLRKR